jgi:HD domain
VAHRIRQGLAGIVPGRPVRLAPQLDETLTNSQREAFQHLSRYDQAHHVRVYQRLLASGVTDRDLLMAGFFHDLGKAALGRRVRLIDRTLAVLLAALAPPLHDRVTRLPAPWWRMGLALTKHHPRVGAELAAALGLSARACWLIEHHGDATPPKDQELLLLIEVDNAS